MTGDVPHPLPPLPLQIWRWVWCCILNLMVVVICCVCVCGCRWLWRNPQRQGLLTWTRRSILYLLTWPWDSSTSWSAREFSCDRRTRSSSLSTTLFLPQVQRWEHYTRQVMFTLSWVYGGGRLNPHYLKILKMTSSQWSNRNWRNCEADCKMVEIRLKFIQNNMHSFFLQNFEKDCLTILALSNLKPSLQPRITPLEVDNFGVAFLMN